ncbi:hypothetical protein [Streptomyces sp. NPDC049040]|uniref:hypothetical protein n=1 Tax=Streptomyces sp. NPDC049040 TaxID=3365593 RepID=UPI003714F206
MDGVLSGLGGKLTERWATLLALPGLAFAATLILAWWVRPLGPRRAADPKAIMQRLDSPLDAWLRDGIHEAALICAIALLGSASALVANELGGVIGRFWLGRHRWFTQLMRGSLAHRRDLARSAVLDPTRYQVPEIYLPATATRIGDSFLLVQKRIQAQYDVGLSRLWPRLWQLCDEAERSLAQQAWDQYRAATVRAAWSVGYLLLSVCWWPAGFVGIFLGLTAHLSARRSAAEFSMAVEALVDVKIVATATALGVPLPHGRFTRADGPALENVLDKGSIIPLPSG